MSNKTQNLFKNQSKSNKANTISEQIKFSSRKMNQICKSLSFPVDKYNVINTIESISGYLTNDKKIERLLYSEISSYVYSLSEDGVATFLSNTEKLLTYVLDKEHDIDENIVKVCIKIYDHTQLIITQISNVNMIARKEIVKNMRDEKIKLHDEVKEIQKEHIAILGIFASIVLAFTAGIAFTTSVLENIGSVSAYRIIIVSLIIGLVLLNIIYALLYYIHRIVKNKYRNIKMQPLWISNIIFIVLIAIIVFMWKDGFIEKRNIEINSKYETEGSIQENIEEKVEVAPVQQ